MPLESGYYYITLDSFTATINPSRSDLPKAEKKIAKLVTLTKTVKQHWQKKSSDRFLNMEWDNMNKSEVDDLTTLDEADYAYYVFTDVYNNSYNVIVADFVANRLGTTDADGFSVRMSLEIVS